MSDIVERLRQYQQVMERLSPLNAAGRPWTLAKDAADEVESLRSRLASADREATVLVVAMADQFGAPDNWKPLPDAAGMITQISNMVAGLREERALIVTRAENAEAALEHVADLYTQACEQRDDADALLLEYSQDALDDLNNWSGYATDYFQQKHDLAGDQAKWQARIDAHLARQL